MKRVKYAVTALIILFSGINIFAQLELPLLSPKASIMQDIGITKVEVVYHRPGVKDRKIWGDVVPYNAVWRAGANEATTIEFSTDVKVNGNLVPKGKYSIFTIPGESEWVVIFNKTWDQWGLDYDKNAANDFLKFTVKPEKCGYFERVLFYFSNTSRKNATLNLAWEKLKISFNIESFLTKDDDRAVRLSPAASVLQRIGITDFKLSFGSPGVNKRVIWGGLVPYKKVWRAGANEATTIEFSTDVIINGKTIPAGRYALFTIPTEKEWTIILNRRWNQWGLDYPKYKSQDIIRFKVLPDSNSFNERLFYNFSDLNENSVTVSLLWEKLRVSFRINVDLEAQMYKQITESFARAKKDNWKIYLDAAEYGIENNFFNIEPLQWIEKSLSMNETYKGHFIKAEYCYKNKQYDEALKQIDKCRDKGQSDQDYRYFISQVDNLERKIKENSK
jgi:hypothetical protein